MPTLTIHDVPQGTYDRLKARAEVSGRSPGEEAAVLLELSLPRPRPDVESVLCRAAEVRDSLKSFRIDEREFDALKREGRE